MFDLQKAISGWRRQMAARGIKVPDVLDQLESHLREDIDQRMHSGFTAKQAFEAAVQQMGPIELIKTEFAKVGRTDDRLRRRLKGMCCGFLAGSIVLAAAWACFRVGMAFGVVMLVCCAAGCIAFSVRGWRHAAQVEKGFNSLSPSGKEALELARWEAPRLQHNYVGTEHVLLGLTKMESGVVANVMKRLGLNRAVVVREVEQLVCGIRPQEAMANIPFTPRVKKALRFATKEAKLLNHHHVGSEDIFLGLLLEGDGIAGRVLKKLGVEIESTRDAIRKESALSAGRNAGRWSTGLGPSS